MKKLLLLKKYVILFYNLIIIKTTQACSCANFLTSIDMFVDVLHMQTKFTPSTKKIPMTITLAQLLSIMPNSKKFAAIYLDSLNSTMNEFDILTPARQASFLSQVGHESGQLTCVEENLNYGAPNLLATWPRHFSSTEATAYARQPERIANRAYASRNGNGDECSGDGWRYRGAGLIQLTFKDNHFACAAYFGIAQHAVSDWLRTKEGATRSAGWFWSKHGLNALADIGDQIAVSRRINGGENGLDDRLVMFELARKSFA